MISSWLTTWDNLGPIVGIFVSVLGFSIAVWQIRRSTGAVEAARDAVERTIEGITKNQVLISVTRASERAQEIRNYYSGSQWEAALYRYHDLWMLLTEIRTADFNLSGQQAAEVDKLIVRLQSNERSLEKAIRADKAPSNPDGHVAILQKVQAILGELSGNLRQTV